MAGLVIPAIRTVMFSFMDPDSLTFIGFDNYTWMFEDPNVAIIMRNTILWLLVTPIFTTALGLLLAVMLDRIKRESIPKSLLFMPMAISFVGASVIWKFIYEYRASGETQIGLLNWIVTQLESQDIAALHDYRRQAPYAIRSHPSDEHLLPLFFARGAGGRFKVEHSGFTLGALGMDIYSFA